MQSRFHSRKLLGTADFTSNKQAIRPTKENISAPQYHLTQLLSGQKKLLFKLFPRLSWSYTCVFQVFHQNCLFFPKRTKLVRHTENILVWIVLASKKDWQMQIQVKIFSLCFTISCKRHETLSEKNSLGQSILRVFLVSILTANSEWQKHLQTAWVIPLEWRKGENSSHTHQCIACCTNKEENYDFVL